MLDHGEVKANGEQKFFQELESLRHAVVCLEHSLNNSRQEVHDKDERIKQLVSNISHDYPASYITICYIPSPEFPSFLPVSEKNSNFTISKYLVPHKLLLHPFFLLTPSSSTHLLVTHFLSLLQFFLDHSVSLFIPTLLSSYLKPPRLFMHHLYPSSTTHPPPMKPFFLSYISSTFSTRASSTSLLFLFPLSPTLLQRLHPLSAHLNNVTQ